MGVIKFLSVRLFEIAVIVLLVVFMPSLPPNANFTYFKVTSPRELEGKLALNDRLSGAERLYENELKGPECFADYEGELYTSLFTGEVVKFSKGHIVPVVQFGNPCKGYDEESVCGRPLGLKFDKNGNLFVADAYMGIWQIDIKTNKKTLLVPMDKEIEGKKPMLPNSIALSENGDIYWTDSSTEFLLEDGVYTLLADGTGRVIHYDAKTKKNKVLFEGLQFANGIILSSDEEFLLVAETGQSRLHRYYLKGPNKGTHDIFIDGLPGMPDNLNSDGQGGFLVPLVVARDSSHPAFTQVFGPLPLVRKFIARSIALFELGFKTIHRVYPNVYTQFVIHWVGHFESMTPLMPRRTTIIRMSKTGEILDSFHATDNSIRSISEAYIFGDHLYLGSPFNLYLARVPLAKVGLKPSKKPAIPISSTPTKAPVKETPTRATKTTPKPTTTPRPATKQVPTTTVPTTRKPQTQVPVQQSTPAGRQTQQTTTTTTTPAPVSMKQATPVKKTEAAEKPQAAKQQSQKAATASTTTTPQPTTATPSKQMPNAATPLKQDSTEKQATAKQQAATKTKESDKQAPKVVPVKENAVPKSESIKPRK